MPKAKGIITKAMLNAAVTSSLKLFFMSKLGDILLIFFEKTTYIPKAVAWGI
jgi:hypothetical protein